jgi:hypothetical protein
VIHYQFVEFLKLAQLLQKVSDMSHRIRVIPDRSQVSCLHLQLQCSLPSAILLVDGLNVVGPIVTLLLDSLANCPIAREY